MHFLIEPSAPGESLLVEIIQIRKVHARPKAILDDLDAALHLSLRLWFSGLADARGYSKGCHEISKDGIPSGRLAIHVLQEDAFHAIGEGRFGQSSEVVKSLDQTAQHRCGIAALDKRDKTHPRIAQHGGKPVELALFALLLVVKFGPIELHLFSWLRFVTDHWRPSDVAWT